MLRRLVQASDLVHDLPQGIDALGSSLRRFASSSHKRSVALLSRTCSPGIGASRLGYVPSSRRHVGFVILTMLRTRFPSAHARLFLDVYTVYCFSVSDRVNIEQFFIFFNVRAFGGSVEVY